MGQEEIFYSNDTTQEIRRVMDALRAWESPLCDGRHKAMILTKLEEAELLSFRLVKEEV